MFCLRLFFTSNFVTFVVGSLLFVYKVPEATPLPMANSEANLHIDELRFLTKNNNYFNHNWGSAIILQIINIKTLWLFVTRKNSDFILPFIALPLPKRAKRTMQKLFDATLGPIHAWCTFTSVKLNNN